MTYTRVMVERLLPAAWDEAVAYGLKQEYAPAPDMPKAATNKAHSNTLYAYIADMKSAWQRAPLDLSERRVVLLRYGMDMKHGEIAEVLGMTERTVSWRSCRGVDKIVAFLNGDSVSETEYEEDAFVD